MADRYWVGGTGTWSDTTKWSTTSGGVGGQSVPATTDNAFFDANSGSGVVTISGGACYNLDTTGFAGSFAATSQLSITGTLLKLTVPYTGTSAYRVRLQPQSGLTQVIDTNNNINGPNVYLAGGTGVSYVLASPLSTSIFDQAGSIFRLQGFKLTVSGACTFASGSTLDFGVTVSTIEAGSISIPAGVTVQNSGNSAFICNNSDFASSAVRTYGSLTINAATVAGTILVNAPGCTFTEGITYNAVAASRLNFPPVNTSTITVGNFQVNGQSEYCYVGNASGTVGSGRVSATTTTLNNVIFDKFTALGTAPWTGDTVGVISPTLTTGIVATAPSTITATLTATTADWFNATIWDLGRAPLPDDDAIINCTAATATLTNTGGRKFYLGSLTYQSTASTVVSSNLGLLLASLGKGYEVKTGISFLSLVTAPSLNLEARTPGTYFIRSALGLNGTACSKVLIPTTSITGATYIVDSDFLISGVTTTNDFFLKKGNLELSANCAFFRVPNFDATGALADLRTITLNSATVQLTGTLTGSSTVWALPAAQGITLNAGSSTIELLATGVNSIKAVLGGFTYNNINLSGNFNNVNILEVTSQFTCKTLSHTKIGPFTLQITGPFAVENFLISGTSTGRITFSGPVSKIGGGTVTTNYLTVSSSAATPANTWFGGPDTYDGNGNTGWTFNLDRYWVGTGDGTWSTTARWAGTSGGIGGAPAPTSTLNAIFDSNSGTGIVSINLSTTECLNFNSTGFAGSFTITGSIFNVFGNITLTRPFTGGAGKALRLTPPASTSVLVDTNNNIATRLDLVSTSSTFTLLSPLSAANIDLSNGTLITQGFDLTSTGPFNTGFAATLNLSTSTVTALTYQISAATIVINSEASTLICNGTTFYIVAPKTFGRLIINAVAVASTLLLDADGCTFALGITYNGKQRSRLNLPTSTTTVITCGHFEINGAPGEYGFVGNAGTAAGGRVSATTSALTNVIFDKFTALGTAPWSGTNVGVLYATGITKTPPTTVTATLPTTSVDWFNTAIWDLGRAPLPDDLAVLNCTGATATITNTGARVFYIGGIKYQSAASTVVSSNLGSLLMTIGNGGFELASGISFSSTANAPSLNFDARFPGTYYIKSAIGLNGVACSQFTIATTGNAGATFVIDSNFLMTTGNILHNTGNLEFGPNCFVCRIESVRSPGTSVRSIRLGSATIELSLVGACWDMVPSGQGLSIIAGTSTITMVAINTSASQTFTSAGYTYYTLKFSGNFRNQYTLNGTNTFNTLTHNKTTGFSIWFNPAPATNIENFLISGSPGNIVDIYLNGVNKTGGGLVYCDYLNVVNGVATPASTWYAGINSTSAGSTTGWIFGVNAGSSSRSAFFFGAGF